MIHVIKPGIQSTVQDLGRTGYRSMGISSCGSADKLAHRLANRLIGNSDNSALIEITLGLCRFQFEKDTIIALTGADCGAKLDDTPLHCGWPYPVKAGQILSMQAPKKGLRSYLAIAGGISVPEVMSSRSTDMMAGFGGFQGRALKSGDRIEYAEKDSSPSASGVRLPQYGTSVRILAGPHLSLLGLNALGVFTGQPWHVSPSSNRMGLRLTLPDDNENPLEHGLSLPSIAVKPGVIQLPPGGEPIVLMPDCQTTGGYPVIGVVIEADLHLLAQLRPGDKVTFSTVDLNEAHRLNKQQEALLKRFDLAQKQL